MEETSFYNSEVLLVFDLLSKINIIFAASLTTRSLNLQVHINTQLHSHNWPNRITRFHYQGNQVSILTGDFILTFPEAVNHLNAIEVYTLPVLC